MLTVPVQFREAAPRNLEYERTVRRLLRSADGWEQELVQKAMDTVADLQKRIAGQLVELAGDDPRRARVEAMKQALGETFDRLVPELQGKLQEGLGEALADYTDGYTGFYRAVGLSGPVTAQGVSTELAVAAANLATEQVVAVGPATIAAITRQVQLAVLGGQSPMDAIRALAAGSAGPDLQAIGPFRTLRQRAEAIVRTETHRMFNVADEIQHHQLSETVPGTKFFWYQYSTRDARETHARVAARTQAEPIGPDELFDVGGFQAPHPHHPSLPAKEVVNCNCKKLPDFRDVDLAAIARRSAFEANELGVAQVERKAAGATAAAAPAVKTKRKTRAKKATKPAAPIWNHVPDAKDWARYLDQDAPTPEAWFDAWAAASKRGKAGGLDDALRKATQDYFGATGYRAGSYLPNRLEDALLDSLDRQAVKAGARSGQFLDAKGKLIPRWQPQQTLADVDAYLEDIGAVAPGQSDLRMSRFGGLARPMEMEAANDTSRALYDVIVKQGRAPLGKLAADPNGSGAALADAWSGVKNGQIRMHPGTHRIKALRSMLESSRANYKLQAEALRTRLVMAEQDLVKATQDLDAIVAQMKAAGLNATAKAAPAGSSNATRNLYQLRNVAKQHVTYRKKAVDQLTEAAELAAKSPWHNQGTSVYDVAIHELGHIQHYRMDGGVTWAYDRLGGTSARGTIGFSNSAIGTKFKAMARLTSQYATTNTKELLAEAFTAYNRGNFASIDPRVLAVIQELVDSLR